MLNPVPSSRRFQSDNNSKSDFRQVDEPEKNSIVLDVVSRMRENKKFIESESVFAEFALKNDFKGKYELYMKGCVSQIKE